MGFFLGNVDKYNARYGKKGETPDEFRKDLMKVLHYVLLALYEHDRTYSENKWKYHFTFIRNCDIITIWN